MNNMSRYHQAKMTAGILVVIFIVVTILPVVFSSFASLIARLYTTIS